MGSNAGGAYLDRNGRRRPHPLHGLEYLSKAPATQFRICLRKRRTLTRTLRQVHEMGAHPVGLLLNGLGIVTPGRRGNERVPQPSPALENPRRVPAKKTAKTLTNGRTFFRLYVYTVTRSRVASQQELALHRNAQQRHKARFRLYRSDYITDQEVHRR